MELYPKEHEPFYRLPKALFVHPRYRAVSLTAKTLYGFLLDRTSLSARNGWVDRAGRVFVYFTQREVEERLSCGHNRATALMRELESAGLVERRRQGQGKPARIYVREPEEVRETAPEEAPQSAPEAAFTPEEIPETAPETDPQTAPDEVPQSTPKAAFTPEEIPQTAPETDLRTAPGEPFLARKRQSEGPGKGGPDCRERAANKKEKNKTEWSETDLSNPPPPLSALRRRDAMDEMREEIAFNIDLEGLCRDHPECQSIYEGYVELMAEVCASSRETIRVCREDVPTEQVRRRLLQLDRSHVEYVRDCLGSGSGPVGNIKAYTLAALYNAPVTMDQYYDALVLRDYPELARR